MSGYKDDCIPLNRHSEASDTSQLVEDHVVTPTYTHEGAHPTVTVLATRRSQRAEDVIKYCENHVIGEGSFGRVVRATILEPVPMTVAIKSVLQDYKFKVHTTMPYHTSCLLIILAEPRAVVHSRHPASKHRPADLLLHHKVDEREASLGMITQ